MERNFALDAFRALAIMLVFTAHSVKSFGAIDILAPLQFGGSGVDLFFVLSGWLIGSQLYSENRRFSNIEIRRFWFRRWMRTMPAYYAVLFVTIAQQYLTKAQFEFPWAHMFFVQNYQSDLSLFYVSWSLSVEEQFYLLIAPFTVLLLKLNRPLQITLLLTLLMSPTLFRSLGLYETLNETHVRIDCCAMGVFLAYIKYQHEAIWRKLLAVIKYLFPLAVLAYIFFYVARYNPQWQLNDPSKLGLAIVFGIWIAYADNHKSAPTSNYWRTMVMHISTRSYAMYLLHVDALIIAKKLFASDNFVMHYAVSLVITLVMAEVLYRLVELPFMNARRYFSFSSSRGKSAKTFSWKDRIFS